ncbi:aminotransferase class I/II-fold pyridoxal phosphate-dependent enzyme [Salinimicrobium oceani]|uniref:Pyridoxal phosphate-dependent aminotransferase family protein n=1 Tax=Salinimicrobium oceani TaxID=2722702 RepID=A0ABX1CXG1_9FLAO|nr:pyridoxal phosphate-dependent aminotransferase family protein [Salinimicrobium oceani]NJW52956.1 pyridoxal phosphate-dependent aminotransferase family protein [Salinimicrobium oceani]
MRLPLKVVKSLEKRKTAGSFRELKFSKDAVDFSSNDYLGFARNKEIYRRAGEILEEQGVLFNGAGGSRLLTGNHELYPLAEITVAEYHKAEAALIFNSGYDANIGFFSAVPGRGDVIFFDELIHASIRDGIHLSQAKAFKFRHNDLDDLREKISRLKNDIFGEVYIVTESIFSMDGDTPPLVSFANFATENSFHLVVDEAHAAGVHGPGLIAEAELEEQVFARLITFGKAMGVHGAAILGSGTLKSFLVNFARSLIYSTALPPHSVASVLAAYEQLKTNGSVEREKLQANIKYFKAEVSKKGFQKQFLESDSAIQACVVSGNSEVKAIAGKLQEEKFDVRPILSPTVPAGQERLRICLHSYNSEDEIGQLIKLITRI